MRTVHERIYSRLTGDVNDKQGTSLQNLLGGSGRIYAGMDWQLAQAPCLVFNSMASVAGSINSDTVMVEQQYFEFRVFANNFLDIALRLRVLLDRYTFAETSDAGALQCTWESDGPELFDENLKVRRRDSRYKIYVMPKAVGAV